MESSLGDLVPVDTVGPDWNEGSERSLQGRYILTEREASLSIQLLVGRQSLACVTIRLVFWARRFSLPFRRAYPAKRRSLTWSSVISLSQL